MGIIVDRVQVASQNECALLSKITFLGPVDAVVSYRDICKIAAEHLENWRELSPELGLKPVDEKAIFENNKDFVDQKRQVLIKWKELKGHAATYRAFINAAKAIRNTELADNVKKMCNSKSNMTHTS